MSVFAYETSWTWWERHPVGTELVLVLSGAVVFHLQHDDGSGARSVGLAEGECLLVPEGAWHRAEITTPDDDALRHPDAGAHRAQGRLTGGAG